MQVLENVLHIQYKQYTTNINQTIHSEEDTIVIPLCIGLHDDIAKILVNIPNYVSGWSYTYRVAIFDTVQEM